ncbi:MAG TPA: 16S rRNA (guanine(527)-N(7))-methyltransferase RsmG [Anaerolineaceae bacterium]
MEKLKQDVLNLLGVQLSAAQLAAFERYLRELVEWNSRFNLTAIRDEDGIRTKHFLDSLSCHLVLRDKPPRRLVDIGTGAGFPGIPLKILYPAMQLTLVESVGKKVEFCRHVVETLNLERVDVVQARAEDLGQMAAHREKYDWAVARSVASMAILAEYLLPLVRVSGAILAQKGQNGPAETQQAEKALTLLGGHLRHLNPIHLPGVAEDRYLIVVDKIAATPPRFPRRVGIPSKTPLG